jgi:tRNA G18 (ribose-2'-O)-methylase SpoU
MDEKERQVSFEDLFPSAEKIEQRLEMQRSPISLLLDGLRIPENIGMIFRLAEAARIQKIFTFNMKDFKHSRKMSRVARSADQYLAVQHLNDLEEVRQLKAQHALIGLERTTHSIPYTQFQPQQAVVLILGSEKHGISQELIDLSDQCIHIPMLGIQTSMNVAVAAGIGVYHLLEVGGHLKMD